ncbi:dynamin family protein [Campylobacter sp. faydin G-140]|uniref:dynamin family protein n=1 Tax=Campylobacter anatolicus TaxID=2829105 RepID=UPI001B9B6B85|nr:dynamin family protein [Campylobacter anatolicus]MBR8464964.1 dynamin family protein [Campylobacter anatolicus]
MFKSFINAYKSAYFQVFGDDFYGKFKRFANAICEPKLHPSVELKDELKKLDLFICEPLTIAIVGQFSSGKSTFLNALLGFEILPTGVTPVTARLTHIRYAPSLSLHIYYKNGRELSLNVSEISRFVDQRESLDDIKELCIYAPSEILKHFSFIDTPGLNSLSSSDTRTTKDVIDGVAGVVWLSLIDNAARASELADLYEFLNKSDKIAICVLNQKDKLNKTELENILSHAQLTYDKIFNQIIAISAKQAVLAKQNSDQNLYESSNFDAVIDAIRVNFSNEDIKERFIKRKCQILLTNSISQHEYMAEIYQKAAEILAEFDANLQGNLNEIKNKFEPKLEASFNEIKEIAKFISSEIISSLKSKKISHYEPKKSFFRGKSWSKNEYEMMSFDSDEIFSKLIYNDVKISKFFKAYKRSLLKLENELKQDINIIYNELECKFMIYKSEFENIRKEVATQSDVEFANIRTHAGQVYEIFLRDFETTKFAKEQKISLFFEKLNLKVATNYESAIKIAVYFIKEKIDIAATSYAKDPLHFALFIPSFNETYERVLTSLNLYEFENEMLSNASFLNKILNELACEFNQIKTEKLTNIDELKSRHINLKDELKRLKIG